MIEIEKQLILEEENKKKAEEKLKQENAQTLLQNELQKGTFCNRQLFLIARCFVRTESLT